MDGYTIRLLNSLGEELADKGLTLCTAESCTGGLIGAMCTSQPGSSNWFRGGVVAYADAVKTGLLRVDPLILRKHGAVSEAVVEAMLRGATQACGAECAIAISGVAGPDGGSPDKPVGTVVIGTALPPAFAGGDAVYSVKTHSFDGARAMVRMSAALEALHSMHEQLKRRGRGEL
ncbi:CinA family protein [Desulfovibrio sp. OttesenSCG-928-C14]|nr:CinA family protein [Desulfovibrio sp. OttesenSCG-928-C14]